MTATQRKLLQLERAQARHFNLHTIKPILEQFDPKFVGFSSTQHKRIAGKPALKKTFEYYLKQSPKIRYKLNQPKIQVYGSMGIASFYWEVQMAPRRKLHGRGTHVFVKRGKNWKIVHEHFSRAH